MSSRTVNSGYSRTLSILLAMALGALLPQGHSLSWAIRWLIMAMLFGVFLQVRLSRSSLQRSHLGLLVANLAMGFGGWALGWVVGGRDVALAAFFAGITPTASAAPVIVSFLRGRVDYVIAAFLITNISIALLIPLMLPLVLGQAAPDVFVRVGGSVGLVVFLPMFLATLVRRFHPKAVDWPSRGRNVAFGLWLATMFLITANASEFVRTQVSTPHLVLLKIVLTTMVVCAANFALGKVIGGRTFGREASQSLGQKNTSFTIYLALTYASPLIALGPTCYVIWHNLWNSWQLHVASARERRTQVQPSV